MLNTCSGPCGHWEHVSSGTQTLACGFDAGNWQYQLRKASAGGAARLFQFCTWLRMPCHAHIMFCATTYCSTWCCCLQCCMYTDTCCCRFQAHCSRVALASPASRDCADIFWLYAPSSFQHRTLSLRYSSSAISSTLVLRDRPCCVGGSTNQTWSPTGRKAAYVLAHSLQQFGEQSLGLALHWVGSFCLAPYNLFCQHS